MAGGAGPVTGQLRCVAGPYCRNPETDTDGEPAGATTETTGVLCDPCRTTMVDAIRQLPQDWQALRKSVGERGSSSSKPAVRSTPTPQVPVSVTKLALMARIVDLADRAAAIISDQLHTGQPDGRRNTAPTFSHHDAVIKPAPDSPAAHAETLVHPDELQQLRAAVAIIEPHLDKLAAAPPEPHAVWDREGENTGQPTQYDPETGEPTRGNGHIYTDISGLDIALDLVEAHHQTRTQLGLTKLRHKMGFPCPRCGSDVGRDDGTTIVDCRNPACKASWTEREFKFLQGLEIEGHEKDILKYLLAEAYTRLDQAHTVIRDLETDERFNQSEAVKLILAAIKPALAGHTPPAARTIATTTAETRKRQLDEDNWSWRNETPYRPPKRKPTKPKPPPDTVYRTSTLTLVLGVQMIPDSRYGTVCSRPGCNIIHKGECP